MNQNVIIKDIIFNLLYTNTCIEYIIIHQWPIISTEWTSLHLLLRPESAILRNLQFQVKDIFLTPWTKAIFNKTQVPGTFLCRICWNMVSLARLSETLTGNSLSVRHPVPSSWSPTQMAQLLSLLYQSWELPQGQGHLPYCLLISFAGPSCSLGHSQSDRIDFLLNFWATCIYSFLQCSLHVQTGGISLCPRNPPEIPLSLHRRAPQTLET